MSASPINRRELFCSLMLPAAGLLGGCVSAAQTRKTSTAKVPEGLGTFAMNQDGTRTYKEHDLVDQDGRKLLFQRDLMEGQVFAATFMYVHCTGICQNLTARMTEAYDLLKPVMGKPVRFYSFSLAEDSPADMKQYMIEHGTYGRPGWSMLTAKREVIRDIRWGFGFFDPNEEVDQDLNGHTGMARFGNQKLDKWSACPALGSPQVIARGVMGVLPPGERPALAGIIRAEGHPARPMASFKPVTALGPQRPSL